MDSDPPLTRAEAQALLAYADVTYRSVTSLRRRMAAVALGLAVLFGILSLAAGLQWAQKRADLAAVEDRPLVDALGVQIPDPRPAIERGQLRVQLLVWGVAAAAAGAIALLGLAVYALVRPPALPPAVRALAAQPPDSPQHAE